MRNNEMTKEATVLQVMEVGPKTLKGYRICISGHLGKPREEVAQLIEQAGGEFHPNVAWNTTHLVTNKDWSAGTIVGTKSAKLRKAEERGVKLLSEQQLYALLSKDAGTSLENGGSF